MTSLVAPDPMAFTLAALSAKGALIETEQDHPALALLPEAVALELGHGDEIRLSLSAETDTVGCGFGTLLLEKLIAGARRSAPACGVRLPGVVRPQQARSLAERFSPRNAVSDLLEVMAGEGICHAFFIGFEAEADDRHSGLLSILVGEDGSEPDEALSLFVNPAHPTLEEIPTPSAPSARAIDAAARRAERAIRRESVAFLTAVEGRHARDHRRTREYFDDLIAEARRPRRKIDPESIAAKVAHLERERDAKLRDLSVRYAASISGSLAASIHARIPQAVVRIRVRRRKSEREIQLLLPCGARSFSKLACDGCLGATAHPAFCDDALHLLCEACVPSAQGRPACPVCSGKSVV